MTYSRTLLKCDYVDYFDRHSKSLLGSGVASREWDDELKSAKDPSSKRVGAKLKAFGFLTIIRPVNCLMIGFGVVIGEIMALNGRLIPIPALIGFLVAFFLMAATMVMNDYYDLEIDMVNNPRRPIPSGLVSPREALSYSFLLSIIGLVFAAFTNLSGFIVAAFALGLMMYYNTRGKRTGLLGNVLVSVCIALPFIYGGIVVESVKPVLGIFSIMAFLSNLGREVTKGVMDIDGDALKGVKTVAVLHGSSKASQISALFFAFAVLISPIPIVFDMVSTLYIPVVAVADLGFIASSIFFIRDPSRRNAKTVKSLALVWMSVGLAAFVAGSYSI
mgnify:FL=1